jgi:hypothetical protein
VRARGDRELPNGNLLQRVRLEQMNLLQNKNFGRQNMAYFEDLTPYEYFENSIGIDKKPVLNVGWLTNTQKFETGAVPEEFKAKLFYHCLDRFLVNLTFGWHVCEICGVPDEKWLESYFKSEQGEKYMNEGNGEIRVIGKSAVYACPALIYHYVVEHQYKPPDEFVEAIFTGPEPGSDEHYSLIGSHILDVYKRE